MARLVEALGVLCPLPVIRLAKVVEACASGERVDLLADDPAARWDVEAWCQREGHDFLGAEERKDGSLLSIRVLRVA